MLRHARPASYADNPFARPRRGPLPVTIGEHAPEGYFQPPMIGARFIRAEEGISPIEVRKDEIRSAVFVRVENGEAARRLVGSRGPHCGSDIPEVAVSGIAAQEIPDFRRVRAFFLPNRAVSGSASYLRNV